MLEIRLTPHFDDDRQALDSALRRVLDMLIERVATGDHDLIIRFIVGQMPVSTIDLAALS